jgi:circadian clock protein KaiC
MRISTGVQGLDHILYGGLLPGRVYLVHGEPGTGKTTMGLHFLSAGDSGLLISFVQSEKQIRSDAASLHLNLDRMKILDLTPAPDVFAEVETYDIFLPAEVERDPISKKIADAINEFRPQRIFVDTFDHFRSLATDPLLQRRFAQSFFRFATRNEATLLVGSEDDQSACVVDGVIQLQNCEGRRSVQVTKFRGSDFHAGPHTILLTNTGIQVPLPPEQGGPRAA